MIAMIKHRVILMALIGKWKDRFGNNTSARLAQANRTRNPDAGIAV